MRKGRRFFRLGVHLNHQHRAQRTSKFFLLQMINSETECDRLSCRMKMPVDAWIQGNISNPFQNDKCSARKGEKKKDI